MPLFTRGKSPEENEDVSLRLTNYFTCKSPEKENEKQKTKPPSKEGREEGRQEIKGRMASSTAHVNTFSYVKKQNGPCGNGSLFFHFLRKSS